MRIFVKTLGCRANRYESEKLMNQLVDAGHALVAGADDAEVVIVNTCTVTHTADRKSRQEIYPHVGASVGSSCDNENSNSQAKVAKADEAVSEEDTVRKHEPLAAKNLNLQSQRYPTEAPKKCVVVFGCGPRASEYEIEGVDLVAKEPAEVLEFLGKGDRGEADEVFMTRANLKIQDGCENFCTYCIVPFARGKCASKPYDELLLEAAQIVVSGAKEIVLTGINIGEWRDDHLDFWDIMKILLDELPVRIRISSIEPFDFDKKVEEVLNHPNFCRHLHICAQSGCDSVLKRMGRKRQARDFKDLIKKIRSVVPEIAITTDIITGFPGETEKEHKETMKFLKDVGFAKVHVFKFSRREGTPAAKAKEQVPYPVKVARSREIRDLADKMRCEYQEKFVGRTLEVLFEQEKGGVWLGTTDNYLQVEIKGDADLRNELRSVRLGMLKKSGRFKGRSVECRG